MKIDSRGWIFVLQSLVCKLFCALEPDGSAAGHASELESDSHAASSGPRRRWRAEYLVCKRIRKGSIFNQSISRNRDCSNASLQGRITKNLSWPPAH